MQVVEPLKVVIMECSGCLLHLWISDTLNDERDVSFEQTCDALSISELIRQGL